MLCKYLLSLHMFVVICWCCATLCVLKQSRLTLGSCFLCVSVYWHLHDISRSCEAHAQWRICFFPLCARPHLIVTPKTWTLWLPLTTYSFASFLSFNFLISACNCILLISVFFLQLLHTWFLFVCVLYYCHNFWYCAICISIFITVHESTFFLVFVHFNTWISDMETHMILLYFVRLFV